MSPRVSGRLMLVVTVILVAANLRPAITVVGPLLERVGEQRGLDPVALGALGAVPLLAFSVISPLVHHLTRRLGLERTIFWSLVVLVLGTLLRSGPVAEAFNAVLPVPDVIPLYAGTALLSAAIGVGNVLVPAVVKRDFPDQVPLMTGVYTASLVGSAAFFTGTAVILADATTWEIAFAIPAAFALLAVIAWGLRNVPETQPSTHVHSPVRTASAGAGAESAATQPVTSSGQPAPPASQPDTSSSQPAAPTAQRREPAPPTSVWRQALAWQVTIYFGLQSTMFYFFLTWFPAIQTSHGIDETSAGVWLGMLQAIGVIASLLVGQLMQKTRDQRGVSAVVVGFIFIALAGVLFAPQLMPLWAMCAGISTGCSLLLALTFVSLRAGSSAQVGMLSGMAQGVGYLLASAGPLLAGALYQVVDSWTPVLWCVVGLACAQAVFGQLAGRNLQLR